MDKVDNEIVGQKSRVKLAEGSVARYEGLLKQDYVSHELVQQKLEGLLDQRARLQTLERDHVVIGGTSVKQVGIDKMVGTVLQDDVLFAGSIADNISFFDPHADQAWVEQCARLAAIAQEIAAMPMAYNTLVGDMGTVLSGGQKQRVLFARALYKRPKILFLDEATSHLDIAKEHEVNAAIRTLDITRIIVAHRPETIASANRVIVLGDGKVMQDAPMPQPTMSKIA